jgi:predicted lipid-binding transport protein (Tim44 family)
MDLPVVAPPAAAPPRRAEPEYVEELDVVLEAESVDPTHAPIATPEPPPPATAYGSLPPVAASAPPPRPERSSSMRGVVFGSLLGLAIVGAFVAGARLAQRPTTALATQPMRVLPEPSPPPAAPVHEEPVATEASSPPSAPDFAVSVVSAAPGSRHARAKTHAAATQAPAPSATAVVAPSGVEPPVPTAVEPSVPTAVASASAAAPDDTGPSLVPVIPASTPAEGDPLVKAVQKDIEEDPTRGRH